MEECANHYLMRIDNKGSRMSMSWKTLASGKLYGENDAKIYRSRTMHIKQVSEVYPQKEAIFYTFDDLAACTSFEIQVSN